MQRGLLGISESIINLDVRAEIGRLLPEWDSVGRSGVAWRVHVHPSRNTYETHEENAMVTIE